MALSVALAVASASVPGVARARGEGMSDDAARRAMIAESTAQYPSVCACPYSVMRNGSSCGRRSAYSRPGGRSPLCYPEDITREMVARWRSGR